MVGHAEELAVGVERRGRFCLDRQGCVVRPESGPGRVPVLCPERRSREDLGGTHESEATGRERGDAVESFVREMERELAEVRIGLMHLREGDHTVKAITVARQAQMRFVGTPSGEKAANGGSCVVNAAESDLCVWTGFRD